MAKRFAGVNLVRCRNAGVVRGMSSKDKAREERLAAALRENLRRRKAQARAVDQSASAPREVKRDCRSEERADPGRQGIASVERSVHGDPWSQNPQRRERRAERHPA